jgi:hypothetical protein
MNVTNSAGSHCPRFEFPTPSGASGSLLMFKTLCSGLAANGVALKANVASQGS